LVLTYARIRRFANPRRAGVCVTFLLRLLAGGGGVLADPFRPGRCGQESHAVASLSVRSAHGILVLYVTYARIRQELVNHDFF
jgi:hypothetical protein